MKKGIIALIFICLAVSAQAQNDAITEFFGKYEADESFTVVNISGRMFGMFTDMEVEDEEDKEVLDAISKLTGLKILAKEDASNGKALYQEASKLLPKKEYEELMTVRSQDNDMRFLVKEKDKKISELVMIVGGDDNFFIMSLVGTIDLKQISKISKKMDIDGLEQLEKLDN